MRRVAFANSKRIKSHQKIHFKSKKDWRTRSLDGYIASAVHRPLSASARITAVQLLKDRFILSSLLNVRTKKISFESSIFCHYGSIPRWKIQLKGPLMRSCSTWFQQSSVFGSSWFKWLFSRTGWANLQDGLTSQAPKMTFIGHASHTDNFRSHWFSCVTTLLTLVPPDSVFVIEELSGIDLDLHQTHRQNKSSNTH